MQLLYDVDAGQRNPILAVVGKLQFEVVQARLEAEYGVTAVVEPLNYKLARWIDGDPATLDKLPWGHGLLRARDAIIDAQFATAAARATLARTIGTAAELR